jgi:hypothetical protein
MDHVDVRSWYCWGVVYGFFRKLSKYIEKLRAEKGKNEEQDKEKRYCPVCGSETEYSETLYFAEWENLFRQGKTIIVFFDPKNRKYNAIINAVREECLAIELLYGN